MATVLISFIGKGRFVPGGTTTSYSGYERTKYCFPAEQGCPEEEYSTSLFGAGLLQRLRTLQQPVARWLVMGTAQSIWANLIEAAPEEEWEALIGPSDVVQQQVAQERVTQPLLDTWQAAMTAALGKTTCRCRLVGAADTEESQMCIWQALVDTVEPGDSIVLDITHGFRHQPVLTSFMVMTLRWLREVKQVVLYYGGLELKGNRPASPVLRLDICNRLIEATEAVATYRHTGNYGPLADQLESSLALANHVQAVALADETNQQARTAAKDILKRLNTTALDPIEITLIPLLREPLEWAVEETLAQRMARKARFAYGHGQYFKSISLLWEAIRVAATEIYGLGNAEWEDREEAENQLRSDSLLTFEEKQTLNDIECLRNAVLHGTRSRRPLVVRALASLPEFRSIFNAGDQLLQRLLIAQLTRKSQPK
jgi:CRISPR-associated Csx2 family protein